MAADTAAWVTNVGNEHGQVLVSVLTAEGEVSWNRYRIAGVALMYVDSTALADSCHVQ